MDDDRNTARTRHMIPIQFISDKERKLPLASRIYFKIT